MTQAEIFEMYEMERFQPSEEFRKALRELRSQLGYFQRAKRRLIGGTVLHKRRNAKTEKNRVETSAPERTVDGLVDRENGA